MPNACRAHCIARTHTYSRYRMVKKRKMMPAKRTAVSEREKEKERLVCLQRNRSSPIYSGHRARSSEYNDDDGHRSTTARASFPRYLNGDGKPSYVSLRCFHLTKTEKDACRLRRRRRLDPSRPVLVVSPFLRPLAFCLINNIIIYPVAVVVVVVVARGDTFIESVDLHTLLDLEVRVG